MASFDILSREISVGGGLFLEASAGTGKTFAIEHLVVRLLLEGKSPLTIDQILVVTFTRAATRELKLRIRSNLEKAHKALEKKEADWDYLSALIAQGEEAAQTAKRRLFDALSFFDEASIFTIHGFCYHLLSERPFEANAPLELSDPDSGEHLTKRRQSLLDLLRTHLAPPSFSPQQIKHLLNYAKGDPTKLVDALLSILDKDKPISPGATFSELQNQFEQNLPPFAIEKELFLEDYQALARCYKLMTHPSFPSQANTLASALHEKSVSPEAFDALIKENVSFLEKMHEENLKVRASLPTTLNYPDLFSYLRTHLLPLIEKAKNPKHLLLRLAASAQKLPPQENLSPDELLKKTRDALSSPSFLALVQEHYRALIMDEFQDTDPVQWEIVQLLCQTIDRPAPSLYLVGDPKQSIYGFRKADVYTFLKASSFFPQSRRSHLTTNFRSTPTLLNALNALFSRSNNWMHLPATDTVLPYQPLQAPPNKTEEEKEGNLRFLLALSSQGKERTWPTKSMERDIFFPFIAKQIAAQREPFYNTAVLVKDRFQAERMHRYFQEVGIPSSLRKKESASDAPDLFPLIQILNAALHPTDPSSLKRALGTPFFGWSIERLKDDEKVAQVKPLFHTLSDVWHKTGIGALLQKIPPTPLAPLLIELEREKSLSPFELLSLLKEIKSGQHDTSLPFAAPTNSVQILTLHMSKGLEFDTVFALGVASRHSRLDEFLSTDETLSLRLDDAVGNASLLETDAEKLRQLYVAFTRAKKHLFIPLPIDEEAKPISKGTASPLELFLTRISDLTLPLSEQAVSALALPIETLSPKPLTSFNLIPETPLPPPLEKMEFPKQPILSFSSLSTKHPTPHFPPSENTLPIGTETGIILHSLLEQIFRCTLFSPFDAERITFLIHKRLARTPLQGWEETVFDLIQSTLHLPLPGNFRLVDVNPHHLLQEMEFVYSTNNTFLKGFIDLAFSHQGTYYIIDWKTNFLGTSPDAYSPENLKRTMEENDYFLQASLYTQALKRYLQPLDPRPFDSCFGGALYIFLRGKRVFKLFPS